MKKKQSTRSETPVEPTAPAVEPATQSPKRGPEANFPIVGIGASAGGLEAFTQLLKALPLDTGMAFVLVQHLDPDHDSALTQILSRATSLPVSDVANKQSVEPNHVYIIPPDTILSIAEGVLKLLPRLKNRTPHRPIDVFFESLALDHGERAIGVVLSGTASDGTLGLEAIKVEGGITFAQDSSAKYDSMPRSAVSAGCVDLVLSPEEIAAGDRADREASVCFRATADIFRSWAQRSRRGNRRAPGQRLAGPFRQQWLSATHWRRGIACSRGRSGGANRL